MKNTDSLKVSVFFLLVWHDICIFVNKNIKDKIMVINIIFFCVIFWILICAVDSKTFDNAENAWNEHKIWKSVFLYIWGWIKMTIAFTFLPLTLLIFLLFR
jgi:hypothetical protein